jgi:hypothetical protein
LTILTVYEMVIFKDRPSLCRILLVQPLKMQYCN